ncbi:hypothetical protein C8R45DRAFT_1217135 [Mycena sanguinolenta]|nr:hypothetical protein C8R45DRAFT_1217135 [Mycena sanguinolenta]
MSHESPPLPLNSSRADLAVDPHPADFRSDNAQRVHDTHYSSQAHCGVDSNQYLQYLLRRQDDLLQKQDSIQKAVEALKPPPVTDTKTKFWNSYMKLAGEQDEEIKEKYSTDLDTSLIFSGLFSAVASAFII